MDERTPLDQDNQLLYAFLNRKKTRDNNAAMTAQRLVNLFRQLPSFNPEFVAQYNQMLLGTNDEIQMMMQDIVGGPTVRQYLTYLQQASGQAVNDSEGAEKSTAPSVNTGYLPSADDDIPFYKTTSDSEETAPKPSAEPVITVQDFTEWQKSQEELITKIMTAQNEAILKLAEALSEKKNNMVVQLISPDRSIHENLAVSPQQPLNSFTDQPKRDSEARFTQINSSVKSSDVTQNDFNFSTDITQSALPDNQLSTSVDSSVEEIESINEPLPESPENSFDVSPEPIEPTTPIEQTEEIVEPNKKSIESIEETIKSAEELIESIEATLPELPENPFDISSESIEPPTPIEEIEESIEPPAPIEQTEEAVDSTEQVVEQTEEVVEPSEEVVESTEEAIESPESIEQIEVPAEIVPETSFDTPHFSNMQNINESQNAPATASFEESSAQPLPQPAAQPLPQPAIPTNLPSQQPENHLKSATPPVSAFKLKTPIPSALGHLFKFPKMPSFKSMPNIKPIGMPPKPSNQSSLPNNTGQSNENQSEIKNQGGN